MLDTCGDAVVVVDPFDNVVYTNRLARERLRDIGLTGDPPRLMPALIRLASEVRAEAKLKPNVILETPSGCEPWRGRAWPLTGGAVAFSLNRVAGDEAQVQAVCKGLGLGARDARLALHATQGLSNRAIADLYSIPVGTVATRMWRLYRKLGVGNRAELAAAVATHSAVSYETATGYDSAESEMHSYSAGV